MKSTKTISSNSSIDENSNSEASSCTSGDPSNTATSLSEEKSSINSKFDNPSAYGNTSQSNSSYDMYAQLKAKINKKNMISQDDFELTQSKIQLKAKLI